MVVTLYMGQQLLWNVFDMKYLLILILLLGLTGCSRDKDTELGGTVYDNLIDTTNSLSPAVQYELKYRNNLTGEIESFPCTQLEYENVANNNAQPKKVGYTFIGGVGGITKKLNDREYLDVDGTDDVILKIDGKGLIRVPKSRITNNSILINRAK